LKKISAAVDAEVLLVHVQPMHIYSMTDAGLAAAAYVLLEQSVQLLLEPCLCRMKEGAMYDRGGKGGRRTAQHRAWFNHDEFAVKKIVSGHSVLTVAHMFCVYC
jgi:hypothetical protein